MPFIIQSVGQELRYQYLESIKTGLVDWTFDLRKARLYDDFNEAKKDCPFTASIFTIERGEV